MFEKQRAQKEYAALVDIGSGSVTISIVYSNHKEDKTEVVWTYHERLLLKHADKTRGRRPLLSNLMQCFLSLGSEGLQHLREFDAQAHINLLQVGISAPWSYTVTKTVDLNNDSPILINKILLNEVRQIAEEKIQNEINENEVASSLDLAVVSRCVTQLRANDYILEDIEQHNATSLSFTLSSVIIQKYLYQALVEARDKVLPNAQLQITSTMLQLYFALRDTLPQIREYCLVNVTLEATEIAVVRNGVFTYSTHEPCGVIDIAKEISDVANIPLAEVYARIQKIKAHLNQNDEIPESAAIMQAYQMRIASLLKQTGDDFTIPKSIYMHCTGCAYDFILPYIEGAAESATNFSHIVHIIPEQLAIPWRSTASNTCIEEISALFFHRYGHDTRFTHF